MSLVTTEEEDLVAEDPSSEPQEPSEQQQGYLAYTYPVATNTTNTYTVASLPRPALQRLEGALLEMADGLHSLGFEDERISDIIVEIVDDWRGTVLHDPDVEASD